MAEVTQADREAEAFEASLREKLESIQMPVIVKEDSKGYHRLYQSPEEPHFVTGDLLAETFGDGDGLIAEAVNALPRLLDEIANLRARHREYAVKPLVEALENVVAPLTMLQREAEARGNRLSGAAYSIANDLGFVQKIARDALEAFRSEQP